MPATCPNCRALEHERHASWCNLGRKQLYGRTPKPASIELTDMLAELTGLFGKQGWPEIAVTMDDGKVRTQPLPEAGYAVVQRARLTLKERCREPIAP